MKPNLYIKALDIGYSLGDAGISFNKMIKNLKSLNYEFAEDLFRDWFYRNFEHKKRPRLLNNPAQGVSRDEDDKKLRLSSESLFQYLEYVELKEARQNSKFAKKQSLIAVGVALCSLLSTLWVLFVDNTQKVSIENVPKHIEESINESLDQQFVINKLLVDIKSKQDSILKTQESDSDLKN